jgi:tRNA(fMet)-specific endonuclease VapC
VKFLLDTNTVIYFFRDQGKVAQVLLSSKPEDICVSCITVFELAYGARRSAHPKKNAEMLDDFLSTVNVLAFGREESEAAAEIRCALERRGVPIGPFDLLIAASARQRNLVLVTHNTREFSRVDTLRVVDWY